MGTGLSLLRLPWRRIIDWWVKQQKCLVSQFWGPESEIKGVARVLSPEDSLLGL